MTFTHSEGTAMFSALRRAMGAVSVSENANDIIVDGIPAGIMTRDIARIWKTSRINTYMFSSIGRNRFILPKFFGVELLYMVDQMIDFGNLNVSSRTLNQIKTGLLENTWLRSINENHDNVLDFKRLRNLIYTPKDYQQEFFDTYNANKTRYNLNGYLLAAAAGAGKTYTALALSEMLDAQKVVIVCPKNATLKVWQDSVKSLFKKTPSCWVLAEGKPYRNEKFVVIHFEALAKASQLVNKLKTDRTVLILDESHNLNDVKSLQTQRFLDLVKDLDPIDVLPMSGTPIKALGAEAIPLLTMLDPMFKPTVAERFKRIYGRDGARSLDILKHRIGLLSFKVEKERLGLAKPVMKEFKVRIPNGDAFTLDAIRADMQNFISARFDYYRKRSKEDHARYEECLRAYEAKITSAQERQLYKEYRALVTRLSKDKSRFKDSEVIQATNTFERNTIIPKLPRHLVADFKEAKTIVKYLDLKIQGEALGSVLGKARSQCHVEMSKYIDFRAICETTKKKTVIFSTSVDVVEATEQRLKDIGMAPLAVYGKTNANLAQIVRGFDKDPRLNPLCATYQSLSTAVPLTMADTMIMIDSPFRAYIREQAISRIHRLGATTQTTVYECRLDTGDKPNISTRSVDILAWSQQQVSAIMGIDSPFDASIDAGDLTISNETYDYKEKIKL